MTSHLSRSFAGIWILTFPTTVSCVGDPPSAPTEIDSGTSDARDDQGVTDSAATSDAHADAGSCADLTSPCATGCGVPDVCCVEKGAPATCSSTCSSSGAQWHCASAKDCGVTAPVCCLTLSAAPQGACPAATPTGGASCLLDCTSLVQTYTVCRDQSDCVTSQVCTVVALQGDYGGDAGIGLCL